MRRPGLEGAIRFSSRWEVGVVTVCPVEDPGCETDTIVTAGAGVCEGCEGVNGNGSASGVNILLICRGWQWLYLYERVH